MGRFDATAGGRILLVQSVRMSALEISMPERLAFVTRRRCRSMIRRIVEALRRRFPALQAPRHEDICYATQNRQDAVKQLLAECDVLIVVGSQSSSTPIGCASSPTGQASQGIGRWARPGSAWFATRRSSGSSGHQREILVREWSHSCSAGR